MSVDARCMPIVDIDTPATADEIATFRELQAQFARSFSALFDDPALPRTVLIVPSLSLDQKVLAKISGVHHYEERMLCLLLLLRMPRTRSLHHQYADFRHRDRLLSPPVAGRRGGACKAQADTDIVRRRLFDRADAQGS